MTTSDSAASTVMNPLLETGKLPAFDRIRAAHVEPAIDVLLARCEVALEAAVADTTPATFDALSETLDAPMQALGEAWGVIGHLKGVCDTPELRAAFAAAQPKVSAFFTRMSADLRLFDRFCRVITEQGDQLSAAQRRAIELEVQGFRLAGAELADEPKSRFMASRLRSSTLSREFSNRLLDATDHFALAVSQDRLAGVPDDVTRAMAQRAQEAGKPGLFLCGLQQSTLSAVLTFAHDRALREQLYRANLTKASEFGKAEWDNGPVLAETLALRQDRASLLGFNNHAEVSLQPKMADTPAQVEQFLRDIGRRVRPHALAEVDELKAFARDKLGLETVQPWDMGYVSEKMREQRFEYSDEEVRKYFQLDKVLPAVFRTMEELFDLQISADDAPVWNPQVTAWRVERNGALLGRFFFDPFSRSGKRGGAWMDGDRARWVRPDGTERAALAYVVTNFVEPAAGQPALLTHGNVITLFHEFGHAFHFLLSRTDVLAVSGISGVEWDAVELPSQLMENMAWDPATIERMTSHVETGAPLPQALYDKMCAARNFLGATSLLRQVEMSLFDLQIHTDTSVTSVERVQQTMDAIRAETALLPTLPENRFQNSFAHIFAGGYAAGYYSYLWAEVLAADAWTLFEQPGPSRKAAGLRYRRAVLERGGSRPMAENFRELMGREPKIDALLKSRGFASA